MQEQNSIFVRVKENVSAEEVAGYYGLHIKNIWQYARFIPTKIQA